MKKRCNTTGKTKKGDFTWVLGLTDGHTVYSTLSTNIINEI